MATSQVLFTFRIEVEESCCVGRQSRHLNIGKNFARSWERKIPCEDCFRDQALVLMFILTLLIAASFDAHGPIRVCSHWDSGQHFRRSAHGVAEVRTLSEQPQVVSAAWGLAQRCSSNAKPNIRPDCLLYTHKLYWLKTWKNLIVVQDTFFC
jgi:hypothetical protein